MSNGPDLVELLDLATDLVVEAGALLAGGVSSVRTDIATKSSATDMVTEMDRASERLLVEGIRSARPDDGVLAEEGTSAPNRSGVRWIIDPLDGTTNYLYGVPAYAVSVAVEVDGIVEVGVVLDAAHGELFSAVRGRGARLDGRLIHTSPTTDLGKALVGTGFGYEAVHRRAQVDVLSGVIGDVRDIRRAGAAAVDLCWVACGRLDAYYEEGIEPWDGAAGLLVAAEAGGRTWVGASPRIGRTITVAANPELFDPLLGLLVRAGAVSQRSG